MSDIFLKLFRIFSETSTHLAEIAMELHNMFLTSLTCPGTSAEKRYAGDGRIA